MIDIQLYGPEIVVLIAGVLLLAAQLGAIPLAWAAARRWRSRRITAALVAWLVGTLAVAAGWLAAEWLRTVTGLTERVYPYYFVVGLVPPWLAAWALYRASRRRRRVAAGPGD
jgi:hypothetical protein